MATRYDQILTRLLKGKSLENERSDANSLARRLSVLSSRHHFIPKYYISGFCKDDGKFFVYDKDKDQILSRELVAKSVFFEDGRNNILVGDLEISILEDFAYGDTDNKLARIFNKILNPENSINDLNEEILPHLLIFVADLFWRNPQSDRVFEDVYDRTVIQVTNHDGKVLDDKEFVESIKAEKWRAKVERANILGYTIRKILEADGDKGKSGKIVETTSSSFIMGDFPVIYESTPRSFSDIGQLMHIFPISSRHLYYSKARPNSEFKLEDTHFLNAIQIHQSSHIVISPDKNILEKSIATYKYLLGAGKLELFRQSFFW